MDVNKIVIGLMALLLLVSAFATVYFLGANSALEQKIASLNATVAATSQKLEGLQSDYSQLRQKYDESQSELADAESLLLQSSNKLALVQAQLLQTEKALNESKQSLIGQQQKTDELNEELSTLENTINSSMSWFRENADMPENYSWMSNPLQQHIMEGFIPRIANDCVDNGNLNLPCISYLMENTAFSIHYREDIDSTGRDDFLQSVKQTIDSGWGDCEDYSLIFKAILNSMREENNSLVAVAVQSGESNEFFCVYPKETPGSTEPCQGYGNAKAARMGILSHAYVICYTVDSSSGHCTVALSSVEINNSSQMILLQGAYVFESQNGEYFGKIGDDLSICTHSGCKQQGGKIWLVIADNDLYMYGDGGWQGYADYLLRVRETRNSISN